MAGGRTANSVHLDGGADGLDRGAVELFCELLDGRVASLPHALHDWLNLQRDGQESFPNLSVKRQLH